jgi:hypothetical protein
VLHHALHIATIVYKYKNGSLYVKLFQKGDAITFGDRDMMIEEGKGKAIPVTGRGAP